MLQADVVTFDFELTSPCDFARRRSLEAFDENTSARSQATAVIQTTPVHVPAFSLACRQYLTPHLAPPRLVSGSEKISIALVARHPLERRSPGFGPICSKNCRYLSSLLPNCLLELSTMRTFEQLCGKLFARVARPRIPTTPFAGSLIFRCIRESSPRLRCSDQAIRPGCLILFRGMLCLGRPHHPCLDKPSTHPGTPKIQDWHAFKFEEGSAPALKAATKCLAVLAVKAVGDIAAGWHKKRRMVWLKSFTH
jgi:hypothetical protein